MIDDAFGHWLAGFVDGEGCFAISKGGYNGLRCVFRMAVRADDAAIVEEIHDRVGLGSISRLHEVKGGRPQATWTVTSKADCLALCALFERYPLRAKKARDFEVWKRAVVVWQESKRGYFAVPFDWSRMQILREELMTGREYKEMAA
jgi:hypothetical protein